LYLDTDRRGKVDLPVGGGRPFRVALSAAHLDIVGDDAEGVLLLAL
jgi:hypothetical protein